MASVEEIRELAERAAAQHAGYESAKVSKRNASAALLSAVVASMLPAFDALCVRERGRDCVVLAELGGARLVCFQDGSLGEVRCGGEELMTMSAWIAVDGWSVGAIAENLAALLEAHLRGSKAWRIEEIAAEAERMRAVATLLRR